MRSVRPALRLLDRSARLQWYLLVPLALLNAAFESAAAVAVFALIKVAGTGNDQALTGTLGSIYDWLNVSRTSFLVLMAVGVAGLYIVKNLSLWLELRTQLRRANDAAASVAVRLVDAYLHRSYELFIQRHTSDYIRTVTISADVVYRSVMLAAVGLLSEAGAALGVLVVLFISAPVATPIITVALALLLILFYRGLRERFTRWGGDTQRLSALSLHAVQDILGAAKEIRVAGREETFVQRFASLRGELATVFVRSGTALQMPRLVLESGFVVVLVLAILILAKGDTEVGDPLPVLGLYTYAGFRLLPSVNRMLTHMNNIRMGGPAVDLVLADEPSQSPADTPAAQMPPVAFERSVELHNATYAYPGTDRPAVRDVSLTLRRGETIGLVGTTGAGKSTLLDLLLGLLTPQQGHLSVDGVPLGAADLAAWQQRIGYVPQAAYLIDDTIRHNIALGVPDAEVDQDALRTAIRLAQLEEVVQQLPVGVDSMVGERGARLSGGQRQRVAIARALYRSPALLVLDEATAGLDNETEAALTEGLRELSSDVTVLIVAHRLSALRNCTRIALMLNGELDDVAAFEELQARNPVFRAIVEAGRFAPAEPPTGGDVSTSPTLGEPNTPLSPP